MRTYNQIIDYIEESDNIYIMSHHNIDLDAFGSCLGVYNICDFYNKKAYIILEEEINEDSVNRSIKQLHWRGFNINYIYDITKISVSDNDLLVICDVNRFDLISKKELIKDFKTIINIDHHIRREDTINSKISYIDDKASSTCEMITFILNNYRIKIKPYVASILLGGIMIDTNNYMIKTEAKTHLAASILYNYGARSADVSYLLKMDIEEYKEINRYLENIKIINKKYAIVCINENVDKELLSKLADTMLTFNNVEASFALGFINLDVVGISARSTEHIDVEQIMHKLGGGGHKNTSAAQIKSLDIIEVYDKLVELL